MATSTRTPSVLVVTTVAASMSFHVPFVRHLREDGWHVDGAASGISKDPRLAGVFEHEFELPFSRSILDARSHMAGAKALDAILRHGYDIVHVHTPIAAFVTRAVVRLRRRAERPKVVYTAHGFHFHRHGHRLTNACFITAEWVAGHWTDRLVVINEEDLSAAQHYKLVPRPRLRHMRGIGVDTDWYAPGAVRREDSRAALARAHMDPDRPYFLTIGELNRNKRPTDVVRALAQMREREPLLLMLGVGPERDRVEELARQLGVTERVVVPGSFVDDVRPFIAPAIALVQASKREGLPRSIMEALSMEVPVVTSAARGCRELVGTERGYVVDIGAPDEMALAMDALFQNPKERMEMGRNGRRQMVARYALGPIITEHERMYGELIDLPSKSARD